MPALRGNLSSARPVRTASLLLPTFLLAGCATLNDPLPSWNDGQAKQRIIEFVGQVTDSSKPGYIPSIERIAVFDNDGTLWPEQPVYFPVAFIFDRIEATAGKHPEWKTQHPFRAVLEKDFAKVSQQDWPVLIAASHGGMTQAAFEKQARQWLSTAKHPRFGVLYKQLVFQPMLELLAYLTQNDFKVFICSGGEIEFLRAYCEETYHLPRERMIGTVTDMEFKMTDAGPVLYRTGAVVKPFNYLQGKPVNIQRHIGRPPVLAFGNSDGDIEMFQLAESKDRPYLALLLHHNDEQREYKYTKGAERALQVAAQRGWTVVSIKNDFKTVFASRQQ